MNRMLVLFIGAIVLALLAWLCISRTAPIVEGDLSTRAKEALTAHDMDWVDVSADGRTVVLKGVAPDAQTRIRASEVAGLIWGAHAIDNHLSIEPSRDADEMTDARQPDEPATVKEPGNTVASSPYRLKINREGPSIGLTGTVPDRETRDALINMAKVQYPEASVNDQLQVKAGAPEGWRAAVENMLSNLDKFEVAEAELVDNKLTVNGQLGPSVDRGKAQDEINRKLPDDYTLEFLVVAPEVRILSKEECRKKFADEFSEKVINFQTNSAQISFEELSQVDGLIKFNAQCPDSRIQVAGHTDARGGDESNKRLSQDRANAVVEYLISNGVPGNRLSAMGFGETRAIADNSSEAGQASNRRIEFIYQGD